MAQHTTPSAPRNFARHAVVGLCALALLVGGCATERGTEAPGAGEDERARATGQGAVLATVGARRITASELTEALAEQEPYVQLRFSSPERKRRFLDELIKIELLAAEARREGLERDPAVVRQVRRALAERLVRELQPELVRVGSLTEAEVAAYYEQQRARYQPRALAEVEQQVRNDLLAERRRVALRAYLDQLRARARIELHPERLAGLQAPKANP